MREKRPIYHLSFQTQYHNASTMLRFAERYESPKFRNKIFTLEEYSDWYVTTTNGEFSYYSDWSGFNFPGHILKPFYDGEFSPLTKKERSVLDVFQYTIGDFYIISTYKSDTKKTITHEIVHGLFYTNKEYAKAVTDIVNSVSLSTFKQAILDMGYCEEVLVDECNAYIMTGLVEQLLCRDENDLDKIEPLLHDLFKSTFGLDLTLAGERDALLSDIHTIDMNHEKDQEEV